MFRHFVPASYRTSGPLILPYHGHLNPMQANKNNGAPTTKKDESECTYNPMPFSRSTKANILFSGIAKGAMGSTGMSALVICLGTYISPDYLSNFMNDSHYVLMAAATWSFYWGNRIGRINPQDVAIETRFNKALEITRDNIGNELSDIVCKNEKEPDKFLQAIDEYKLYHVSPKISAMEELATINQNLSKAKPQFESLVTHIKNYKSTNQNAAEIILRSSENIEKIEKLADAIKNAIRILKSSPDWPQSIQIYHFDKSTLKSLANQRPALLRHLFRVIKNTGIIRIIRSSLGEVG